MEPECSASDVYCDGVDLLRCNLAAGDYELVESCAAPELCDAEAMRCHPTCRPGDVICQGADVERCNQSGDGYELVRTCGARRALVTAPFKGIYTPPTEYENVTAPWDGNEATAAELPEEMGYFGAWLDGYQEVALYRVRLSEGIWRGLRRKPQVPGAFEDRVPLTDPVQATTLGWYEAAAAPGYLTDRVFLEVSNDDEPVISEIEIHTMAPLCHPSQVEAEQCRVCEPGVHRCVDAAYETEALMRCRADGQGWQLESTCYDCAPEAGGCD
jgi:hypothetical protein